MTFNRWQKWLALVGSALLIVSTVGAGVVWAMDQRYWNISEQKQFEVRELKRDVKKAELQCQKTGDETECAFYEFLKQDLDALTK